MNDKNSYYLPFPKRLRILIDETRVSQQEIADYVGVSRQAVAQWKDGKTIPDMYNFKKVAEFFKVPMEYLYGETDSRVKENLALSQSLGLSDRAIAKLQAWSKIERKGTSFPISEIISDIIADDDFDNSIKWMQQVISEYIEHRLHVEYDENKTFYPDEGVQTWTAQDADNYARLINMRAIKAEDLSAFYKYQAIEAIERVLSIMPENYYAEYRTQL